MADRVGMFGGSFDPIHFGHLISARSIAEQLQLSRVVLIPSPRPPHKPADALIDARHRIEMTRRAVAGDPLFEVSEVELGRSGPSYTIDTVDVFRERYGVDSGLVWIIGADSLPELATWHRVAELVDRVRIVTATRPGRKTPDMSRLGAMIGPDATGRLLSDCFSTPAIDISATAIRQRIAEGRPVRYLTPDAVIAYIETHGIYVPRSRHPRP
ncbi:MAG: nicotinate-nucleotide adenylyltransferase [Phycisphaerae bacterium]